MPAVISVEDQLRACKLINADLEEQLEIAQGKLSRALGELAAYKTRDIQSKVGQKSV